MATLVRVYYATKRGAVRKYPTKFRLPYTGTRGTPNTFTTRYGADASPCDATRQRQTRVPPSRARHMLLQNDTPSQYTRGEVVVYRPSPAAPSVSQEGMAALEAVVRFSASMTAAFAAALASVLDTWRSSSAGSAPLSSTAARAAQPASVIWVLLR